jgi:hypothetical protein
MQAYCPFSYYFVKALKIILFKVAVFTFKRHWRLAQYVASVGFCACFGAAQKRVNKGLHYSEKITIK